MGNQNDTIELNGYRYDAKTGARLGPVTTNAVKPIDGFMRRRPGATATPPKKPVPSQTLHRKTAKSRTLMRSAVKKPDFTPAQAPTLAPIHKRTINTDLRRIERANQAPKNPQVKKFHSPGQELTPKITEFAPKSVPVHALEPAEETKARPKVALPLSPFDMALQNAKSHEQPKVKGEKSRSRLAKRLRLSPRAASLTAGIAVALIGGIFIANRHLPALSVHLAAARAGVEARLPSYQPAGFSLAGPIEYSSGQITLQYQSNSDDRSFRVVQKKTDWNSQSLLENFIAAEEKDFQTLQDKGKTIFIYDNNNATWVSGGIWYQVEGESSLNSDQLLRIASGL